MLMRCKPIQRFYSLRNQPESHPNPGPWRTFSKLSNNAGPARAQEQENLDPSEYELALRGQRWAKRNVTFDSRLEGNLVDWWYH